MSQIRFDHDSTCVRACKSSDKKQKLKYSPLPPKDIVAYKTPTSILEIILSNVTYYDGC